MLSVFPPKADAQLKDLGTHGVTRSHGLTTEVQSAGSLGSNDEAEQKRCEERGTKREVQQERETKYKVGSFLEGVIKNMTISICVNLSLEWVIFDIFGHYLFGAATDFLSNTQHFLLSSHGKESCDQFILFIS